VASLSVQAPAFVPAKFVPPLPPGPPPARSAEEAARQRFGRSDGSEDGGGGKGKPGGVRQREKKREKKREVQAAWDKAELERLRARSTSLISFNATTPTKAEREQRWKEMLRAEDSWAEWAEEDELLSPVSRPSGTCSLTRGARQSLSTHTPPSDGVD
jgi:hypothetical protein